MGRPIARRLLESGFKLTAYDRNRAKAEELIPYGGDVAQSVSELSFSQSRSSNLHILHEVLKKGAEVRAYKQRIPVERDTILIPISVLRYFTPVERIDPLYVQTRSPKEVDRVALRVQEILEARHRPGSWK